MTGLLIGQLVGTFFHWLVHWSTGRQVDVLIGQLTDWKAEVLVGSLLYPKNVLISLVDSWVSCLTGLLIGGLVGALIAGLVLWLADKLVGETSGKLI